MTARVQDPDDVADYTFDFTGWLEPGETIINTAVACDGMTVGTVTEDGGVVTYRISGGVSGGDYYATCHVITSTGREKDVSDRIAVRSTDGSTGTPPPAGQAVIDGGTP